MNVKIAVSWCTDILKAVFILWSSCPRRMWRWGWDHHKERFKIRFILQEVQWHVSLWKVLLKKKSLNSTGKQYSKNPNYTHVTFRAWANNKFPKWFITIYKCPKLHLLIKIIPSVKEIICPTSPNSILLQTFAYTGKFIKRMEKITPAFHPTVPSSSINRIHPNPSLIK